MDIKQLASKHNYLTEIPILFETSIWEYDIRQANINALMSQNRISEEEYEFLQQVPKQRREVEIGMKIKKDHSIQDSIYKGIENAKLMFLDMNRILPNNVLRIANDSIYVIQPYPVQNTIMNINGHDMIFVLKNHFTAYMNLNKIQFFLESDITNDNYWTIDVKGIASDKLYLHQAFISFLCNIIQTRNMGGQTMAIDLFNQYYTDYVNYRLPVENYREFNSYSGYRISGERDSFMLSDATGLSIHSIDIGYNLMLLRKIYSYLLSN